MAGITRRTFAQCLAAVAVSAPTRAAAQPGYPAGLTVKFVAGFPAGDAQDIVGRVIADRLGALWKVPTVVENVAGAGGNLGMDRVAKGPSDGSHICIVPPGIATNQYLYARVPFDPEKDFVLLGHVASVPNLLCVRKDLPVDTVAELIAHAKANPGKLNYASSGIGTTVHLSAELFKRMTGVDMVHVAYRGSAPALNDLVGQNVDLMFDNITSIIGPCRRGEAARHYVDAAIDAGPGISPQSPKRSRAMTPRRGPAWRCALERPRRSATKSKRTPRSFAKMPCSRSAWPAWWLKRSAPVLPSSPLRLAPSGPNGAH